MLAIRDFRVLVWIALFCIALAAGAAGGQTTGPRPLPLVPESMRGADLFRLYCATCHGRDGHGHGPVASSLKTPPSDLTHISMRNSGLFPRARVDAIITGSETVAAHGSEDMPVWGPIFRGLDTSEARVKVRLANLVSYLESIQEK
jgi:mono/diheme cytochrome c family protein